MKLSGHHAVSADDRAPERLRLPVMIVAEHRLLAQAVERALAAMDEVSATSSATSVTAAVATARLARPEIVLVDDQLGERSQSELIEQLTDDGWRPAVLVFASCEDPASVVTALRAGASGWVAKDCMTAELRSAIAAVSTGRRWLGERIQSEVLELLLQEGSPAPSGSPLTALSARQRDVLGCLMEGLTHGATAARLSVSPNTVRTHVRTMCQVLNVHSTPALVSLARRWEATPAQVCALGAGPI